MPFTFQGCSPPARLEELLVQIQARSHQGTLETGLVELFGLQKSTPEFFCLLADVHELINDCRLAVDKIPSSNPTRYSVVLNQVFELFSTPRLQDNYANIQSRIVNGNLSQMIGLMAETMSTHNLTDQVKFNEIKEWQSQVSELISSISSTNEIEQEIRAYLVSSLEHLMSALLSYQIRGAKSLREHVELAMMNVMRAHANLKSEPKGALREIVEKLLFIDTVLTHTVSAYEKSKVLLLTASVVGASAVKVLSASGATH